MTEQSHSQTGILEKAGHFIHKAIHFIKYFLALAILVAIVISFWSLPQQFMLLFDIGSESLMEFIEYTINIIIALELVEVLSQSKLETLVEILLIALTRELVIEKRSMQEFFIGVLAIAILFFVFKYLVNHGEEEAKHIRFPKLCGKEKGGKGDTLEKE